MSEDAHDSNLHDPHNPPVGPEYLAWERRESERLKALTSTGRRSKGISARKVSLGRWEELTVEDVKLLTAMGVSVE